MAVDIYPARLEGLEDHALERVRVRVDDGRVRVWRAGAVATIEKIYDGAVEGEATRAGRGAKTPWSATLADGRTLTFVNKGGCGCGDPLKRYDTTKDDA